PRDETGHRNARKAAHGSRYRHVLDDLIRQFPEKLGGMKGKHACTALGNPKQQHNSKEHNKGAAAEYLDHLGDQAPADRCGASRRAVEAASLVQCTESAEDRKSVV